MMYKCTLKDINIELTSSIARHSGNENLAYKVVDGKPIYLSIFYPLDYKRDYKFPVLFLIHGGGWESHKIFEGETNWQGDYLGYLARYFSDKGYICISIDYRLMQEMGQKEGYQLTDLYSDCKDAVNYILDHESKLKIDITRAYVLGESAGGHLAGLLATKYRRENFSFKCAFLVNAITDLV